MIFYPSTLVLVVHNTFCHILHFFPAAFNLASQCRVELSIISILLSASSVWAQRHVHLSPRVWGAESKVKDTAAVVFTVIL